MSLISFLLFHILQWAENGIFQIRHSTVQLHHCMVCSTERHIWIVSLAGYDDERFTSNAFSIRFVILNCAFTFH